ncbi:MAG: hypothetical protein ACE5KM_13620 [Planctomycetaceae bacterium]
MGLFTPLTAELSFSLPTHWLEWTLVVGGFSLAMILAVVVYIFDCKRLHPGWTMWLLFLRLAVFVVLIVILLNPQDRTSSTLFTPSRVIFMVDTSTSMGFREKGLANADDPSSPAGRRTRTEAVVEMLENTPMIAELRKFHEVSFYTFDKDLSKQAGALFPSEADDSKPSATPNEKDNKNDKPPLTAKSVHWKELLKPEGRETRLGDSLRELMRAKKGKTLSAIVVISDGQWNTGMQPSAARQFAKKNKVRLFTVGVGPKDKPVNVRVARIEASSDVIKGAPYDITAFIQGDGTAGRELAVKLEVKPAGAPDTDFGDVEGTNAPGTILMGRDGESKKIVFNINPQEEGKFEYRVSVQSGIKEFDQKDNERRHEVNVVQRNLGVLLIAGGPMRDYRFARNLLFREKTIDVDIWLQTVDESHLADVAQDADDILTEFPASFPTRPLAIKDGFVSDPESRKAVQYDVIVAFDPNWGSPGFEDGAFEKISKWVAAQAGGMLVVAGDVNAPGLAAGGEALDEIRRMYPVVLSKAINIDGDSKSDTARAVTPTAEGRDIPFLRLGKDEIESENVWKDFDGFFRCYGSEGKKAGAVVYMYYNDPVLEAVNGSKPILLASQYYGVGRIVYLGTSELWRLRSLDEDYFDRFWVRGVREVGQGRLSRRSAFGTVLLRKDRYFVGETVRVEANLVDVNNKPVEVPEVAMDVTNPLGEPLEPQPKLLAQPGRPGFFVGNFSVRLKGTYRLTVNNPALENQSGIPATVKVEFSQKEMQDPRQNARVLEDLARDTGGSGFRGYYELSAFRGLFASIAAARKKLDALKNRQANVQDLTKAEEQLAAAEARIERLFDNKGTSVEIKQKPRTLWDKIDIGVFENVPLLMIILVSLLSVEWLTRKLLKLA